MELLSRVACQVLWEENKEEFALESTLSRDIGAMDRVSVHVCPVERSDRVMFTSIHLPHLGVIRSAKLLEFLDHVLLSDLHGDGWPTDQLVNCVREVSQERLVELQEFFCLGPVQEAALDGADLEPFVQDAFHNLAGEVLGDSMGFDQTQGTVRKLGCEP